MTDQALARLDETLSRVTDPHEVLAALHRYIDSIVGSRLFTVTIVDMAAMLVHRAYTSNPGAYALSGTKPIEINPWFEAVHVRRETFVANSIEEMMDDFPDHAQIAALGCGSVINAPVFLGDDLVATVNILDAPGHYTAERSAIMRGATASLAMKAALMAYQRCGGR